MVVRCPGVPDVPSAEELSALPPPELPEAYRLIGELTARVERLSAGVEDLRRRVRRDSLLTEHGRAFPQLEGLAVALGYTVTARG
jgi:hypothetical protein